MAESTETNPLNSPQTDLNDTNTNETQSLNTIPQNETKWIIYKPPIITCDIFLSSLITGCILAADILLIFWCNYNKFSDQDIFWLIYLTNVGTALILDIMKILSYICKCCATYYKRCVNPQSKWIKLLEILEDLIDITLMVLAMYLCSFSQKSIITYSSFAGLIVLKFIWGYLPFCEAKQNEWLSKTSSHKNKSNELKLQTWNVVVTGLQTLPLLYYSTTSYFRTLWFDILITVIYWYPSLLVNILLIANNLQFKASTDDLLTHVGKQYGDYITQTEFVSYQSKMMSKMFEMMGDVMNDMQAGNIKKTTNKMQKAMGSDIGANLIKLVAVVVSVFQLLYSGFIWILHIMHIANDKPKNKFETVWSMINVIIPVVAVGCFGFCWLKQRHMMQQFNSKF